MAKLNKAEEKLLNRGFDWAADSGGYDPAWDESDVLNYLERNPNETVMTKVAREIKLPVHRVIAAKNRLEASGRLPKPSETVIDFRRSTGNVGTSDDYDPALDESAVLRCADQEGVDPRQVYNVSKKTNIPVSRVIAAVRRLDESGRLPNDDEPCSTGEAEAVAAGNCEQKQSTTNILFTEPNFQKDENGQLSIFWDTSDEAPEPDDYETTAEYDEAWAKWEKDYPELAKATAALKQKDIAFSLNVAEKQSKTTAPQQLEQLAPLGHEVLPDSSKADKSSKLKSDTNFKKGDRVQHGKDSRRIGTVTQVSSKGIKVKWSDSLEGHFTTEDLETFKDHFFKEGDRVITQMPNYKGIIFTVQKCYESGMVSVTGNSGINISLPANWLEHYLEKVEKSPKSEKSEKSDQEETTTKKKRPPKGCGSGYLKPREANKKRNEEKGKPPDIYYVYYYSYSNQYGKEIKSSISVPRAKVSQVKKMIENREHYVKICKFLGKSVSYFY